MEIHVEGQIQEQETPHTLHSQEIKLSEEGMTWRLLVDKPGDATYNMAVDEAIMLSHAKGEVPPTLRLYQWRPAAVSIGFSQDLQKKVDVEKCRELGLGLVRRPTGGRAVLHDQEITYSVVISQKLLPGSVLQTYKFLSTGLLEAMKELGLEPTVEDKPAKSQISGSPACFDSPSWYEIEVSGRKLVGSAQTRQRGVLLQHGSVLLDLDIDKLLQVLITPSEKVRRRMATSLEAKATAVNPELLQAGRQPAEPAAVEQALIEGFQRGLGITLERGHLTDNEASTAEQLAKAKYSSSSWTLSRKGCVKPCTT